MPGSDEVNTFLDRLDHPLRTEIDEVREIILGASRRLSERVKWNAPSYHYKQDLVTFNLHATNRIHLVFHHVAITRIESDLLEGKGKYDDRRMIFLADKAAIRTHRKELQRVVADLVRLMDEGTEGTRTDEPQASAPPMTDYRDARSHEVQAPHRARAHPASSE